MSKHKVWHIFNSSIVSGPEKAIIPNLPLLSEQYDIKIVFLIERRLTQEKQMMSVKFAQKYIQDIECIEVKHQFDFKSIYELQTLIQNEAPHLIHAHDIKASLYLLFSSLKAKSLIISTFHGFARRGLKNKLYEFLYFFFINFFDQVITLNPFEEQRVLKRLIKTYHTTLIPNGISLDDIKEKTTKLNNNKINLVSVGRLSEEKNHSFLLNALSRSKNKNLHIHFYGNGPLENELKNLSNNLNIQDQVTFYGYVQDAHLLISKFDFFILPSLTEGVPICLLEATLSNLPIIASDIPGVRYVLPHQEMGIFFSPSNIEQLAKILSSLKQGSATSPNFPKIKTHVLNNFSAKCWSNNTKLLYKKLLT